MCANGASGRLCGSTSAPTVCTTSAPRTAKKCDDVDEDGDEDEEDPFTVLRTKRPWATPFLHGDGASAVSSVAPSAAGSLSGSRPSTRLLCIECYAPSRMALSLRAELYHTLDDLEELRRVEVLTLARGHHARRRVFWRQRGVNRGRAAA